MTDDARERATRLIGVVELRRKKWETWFPDPESALEVSRADFLALVEIARETLAAEMAAIPAPLIGTGSA